MKCFWKTETLERKYISSRINFRAKSVEDGRYDNPKEYGSTEIEFSA